MTDLLPRTGDRTLWVAETFVSVQGEGPSLGRRALFVRLSGCHLSCVWCDTPYTWDKGRFDLAAERRAVDVDDLVSTFLEQRADLVVVTGGEPLLQQPALVNFLQRLAAEGGGCRVEVETSGTLEPRADLVELVTVFNVSPKLAHSGLAEHRRVRPKPLWALRDTGKVVWKFVVTGPPDLDEVSELLTQIGAGSDGWGGPVWVMPEGTTGELVLERLRALAAPVIQRGWNLTPRLHILLWGDERGR
ncbi:7-carboxy-7-deazaguanine synthase QueE [Plantactinospora mayteni]|uniref:7-carboxy-7-deazaguanine synthase n=1 Tax=Plantactinospora mayteni TaxID=566021 RepID=A0ABQ4EIT5_9ACTN|nr:7-carboxy-7-deazaguanine synthase QueE [Plantactinospora mayteni]GIG94534.1 radical SAM protein [Plantactinospora mayteni]